jgi:hypothetical protein
MRIYLVLVGDLHDNYFGSNIHKAFSTRILAEKYVEYKFKWIEDGMYYQHTEHDDVTYECVEINEITVEGVSD